MKKNPAYLQNFFYFRSFLSKNRLKHKSYSSKASAYSIISFGGRDFTIRFSDHDTWRHVDFDIQSGREFRWLKRKLKSLMKMPQYVGEF